MIMVSVVIIIICRSTFICINETIGGKAFNHWAVNPTSSPRLSALKPTVVILG